MIEHLTFMAGLVGLALLPHLLGFVLLAVGLYLLWHLWPYLLLALAAIPVVLVGGALSAAALLAMAYGFAWLAAFVLSPFDPVSPPIPYCALCYHPASGG